MKKFLQMILLLVFLTGMLSVNAQTRFLDEVFTDVQVDTSKVYAENFEFFLGFNTLIPLVMDVYTPVGDAATNRPLVLLSHNGSFLPEVLTGGLAGFCFNGRKDSSIVELCKRFARRGYVAVSFDYRLGWSSTSGIQEVRTKTIIRAVYRAMQDAKSLVRFFKDDFANHGNTWGIDTGKIVIGGSNSGAYVALAASSLNDPSELVNPKFIGSDGPFIKPDTIGDFEGFGGVQNHDNYPGISSRFQCALSLGGAVGDTSWIQAGETPVIAFHGIDEESTPYNTAVVIVSSTGDPVIEVSGAGDFMPVVDARGNNNVFKPNTFLQGPPNKNGFGMQTSIIEGLYPFYGQYFEPWNWYEPNCYTNSSQMQTLSDPGNSANWATPAKANRYLDTVMLYTLPRLHKLFDLNNWSGIDEPAENKLVTVFPNPASSELNISVDEKAISSIHLFDLTGRLVKEISAVNSYTGMVDVSTLDNGIYLLSVKLTDGIASARKILIEK